jgi:hypothetical protein
MCGTCTQCHQPADLGHCLDGCGPPDRIAHVSKAQTALRQAPSGADPYKRDLDIHCYIAEVKVRWEDFTFEPGPAPVYTDGSAVPPTGAWGAASSAAAQRDSEGRWRELWAQVPPDFPAGAQAAEHMAASLATQAWIRGAEDGWLPPSHMKRVLVADCESVTRMAEALPRLQDGQKHAGMWKDTARHGMRAQAITIKSHQRPPRTDDTDYDHRYGNHKADGIAHGTLPVDSDQLAGASTWRRNLKRDLVKLACLCTKARASLPNGLHVRKGAGEVLMGGGSRPHGTHTRGREPAACSGSAVSAERARGKHGGAMLMNGVQAPWL